MKDAQMESETIDENEYGSNYKEHVLQMYVKYIETIDNISDRRQNANNFFLSINTALVAFLSFSGFGGIKKKIDIKFLFIIIVVGIILSILWYRIIKSYRDLNTGKFKVLFDIEKRLPLSPFSTEWNVIGNGKKRKLYLPFSHIECIVPFLFMAIYVSIIILSLFVK